MHSVLYLSNPEIKYVQSRKFPILVVRFNEILSRPMRKNEKQLYTSLSNILCFQYTVVNLLIIFALWSTWKHEILKKGLFNGFMSTYRKILESTL